MDATHRHHRGTDTKVKRSCARPSQARSRPERVDRAGRVARPAFVGARPVGARLVGAIALLATGGVHLQQYEVAHFADIPTIGWLFLANFIAASVLGLVLLIPARGAVTGGMRLAHRLAAVAGIGLAGGALVGLLVSEHTTLFGFMEHGYRLEIVVAIVAEAGAIVSLGAFVVAKSSRPPRRGPDARAVWHRILGVRAFVWSGVRDRRERFRHGGPGGSYGGASRDGHTLEK